MSSPGLECLRQALERACPLRLAGRVTASRGPLVLSRGPRVARGSLLRVLDGKCQGLELEVIGFEQDSVLSMPLGLADGLEPGARLGATDERPSVPTGDGLRGRVLDALGRPLDALGPLQTGTRVSLDAAPVNALERGTRPRPFRTGVRVVDQFVALAEGQRVGVFSASGVGKTTLLAMLARRSEADVNVVALVGERSREVRPFIESALGSEGLARSVVLVATSAEPAVLRVRAAFAATAIAQSFVESGRRVLLLMDSLSRFAQAQRELGLASGEPQTARGYTPSVFAALSRLLERAGCYGSSGSITGLYSVLYDGEPFSDPLAEALQALLDGHIVLSAEAARAGRYPAVDPLLSLSRLMQGVLSSAAQSAAAEVRRLLATQREVADLVAVGAYQKGVDAHVDRALRLKEPLHQFLQQRLEETSDYTSDLARLEALLREERS